jgi:hypothetical protein
VRDRLPNKLIGCDHWRKWYAAALAGSIQTFHWQGLFHLRGLGFGFLKDGNVEASPNRWRTLVKSHLISTGILAPLMTKQIEEFKCNQKLS